MGFFTLISEKADNTTETLLFWEINIIVLLLIAIKVKWRRDREHSNFKVTVPKHETRENQLTKTRTNRFRFSLN